MHTGVVITIISCLLVVDVVIQDIGMAGEKLCALWPLLLKTTMEHLAVMRMVQALPNHRYYCSILCTVCRG